MWVYVFLGNLLRGIGETPVQPLGIAYLDDFASEDNAAFYIGKAHLIHLLGKQGSCFSQLHSKLNRVWTVFIFHTQLLYSVYTILKSALRTEDWIMRKDILH